MNCITIHFETQQPNLFTKLQCYIFILNNMLCIYFKKHVIHLYTWTHYKIKTHVHIYIYIYILEHIIKFELTDAKVCSMLRFNVLQREIRKKLRQLAECVDSHDKSIYL